MHYEVHYHNSVSVSISIPVFPCFPIAPFDWISMITGTIWIQYSQDVISYANIHVVLEFKLQHS